jgi:hypothetical protein
MASPVATLALGRCFLVLAPALTDRPNLCRPCGAGVTMRARPVWKRNFFDADVRVVATGGLGVVAGSKVRARRGVKCDD